MKQLSLFLSILLWTIPLTAKMISDATSDAEIGNITAVHLTQQNSKVVIELNTADVYKFLNTQILIDTDSNPKTGFAIDQNGYDLLIEGANILRFNSIDQHQWDWVQHGQAKRYTKDSQLRLMIPIELLNTPQMQILARTLSPDYTTVLDRVPDQNSISIPITKVEPDIESKGDADDPTRDLILVKAKQNDDRIVLNATTENTYDFSNTLIFIDTDMDATTGFNPPANPQFGFELLLSGSTLSKHNSSNRSAWTWQAISQAKKRVLNNKLTVDIDAGALRTDKIQYAVWNMSDDWQLLLDQAPDTGLYTLAIDTSKITERPESKPIKAAARRVNTDLPPRERFAQADSFYTYYGSGRYEELSHYDIAVMHSPAMELTNIAKLKALGVVTIGYITVGEDDKLREGNKQGPGGTASWYYDRDGDDKPDMNGIWKSYYANAGDPNWRADRVAEAKRLVNEEGYDGIFLDTLDTTQIYPESTPGMIQLVKELREAIPDSPIVLNQGFRIFDKLAPYADGLMLESFTATYDFRTHEYKMHGPASLDWHLNTANKYLLPVLKKHPMNVLVLDYALSGDLENIQTAADRAATFGFLFSASPIALDDVYHYDITPQPNDKWKTKFATPERLSHTITESINGFPANTVLKPSGCYGGYQIKTVVDGIEDRRGMYWSEAAWASAEDGEDAWIEIHFPKPKAGGTLTIQWAEDSKIIHASRDYRIEHKSNDQWISVPMKPNVEGNISTHSLPDTNYKSLRIYQPAGGGGANRPNLMWIAQIKLQ